MAKRTRIERIIEIAGDVAQAVDAVNKLRQGKNAIQVKRLADVLEREVRSIAAQQMRRRRNARRQGRNSAGRFV